MSLPRLVTSVDPRSQSFRENYEQLQVLITDFAARMLKTSLGGPEASRERHAERGKLLPRDRVNELLDPARLSLSSRHLRPMACMTMKRLARD
jgi:3-methylcrotonyl-CoA carboxylase beta subunit